MRDTVIRPLRLIRHSLLTGALCAATISLAACGGGEDDSIGTLRLIGEQRIALNASYQSTSVGGLSGIDYDPKSGDWVLVSDDRSDVNPARFYTARLNYDDQQFSGVELRGVTTLKQADGSDYPSRKAPATGSAGKAEIPDIEAIRFDPRDQSLWYASEGDKTLGLDPFIRQAAQDGRLMSRLSLPELFSMSTTQQTGPRNNDALEGLTFSADGASLWASMEAPLYQDGAAPTMEDGGNTRVTQFYRNGAVLRQIVYQIEKIPAAPGAGKAANNGVSEMLAIDDTRFLMLERAGVQADDGSYRNFIRLYEMDITDATDVSALPALKGARFTAASKRLVLDLSTLSIPRVDNIEGMTWGPPLQNGNKTLVLMSDNNFNPAQVTQLLALEVIPPEKPKKSAFWDGWRQR